MKKIIRKILKESEGDFEWVELDVDAVEKEVKEPFKSIEYDFRADMGYIYDSLIAYGVRDPNNLKELGEMMYREFQRAYDHGYDSGLYSCTCDGCCDDYVYYEDHNSAVKEAREEGYNEGFVYGHNEGFDEGHDEGYDEGRREGYNEGFDEGYKEGYDEGSRIVQKNIT